MSENEVIDINNFDQVYEAVDIALDEGMEALHFLTMKRLVRNWKRGKDAMGNPWTPLAPETIRAKGHDDILIDSGTLLSDVQASSEYDSDTRTSVITTTTEYGAVHEFGMPERGIPQRSFLQPAAEYANTLLPEPITSRLDDELAEARI